MTAGQAAWYPAQDETSRLTDHVLRRRIAAWCIDSLFIGLIAGVFWFAGVVLGLLTFGLGFHVLVLLPVVPFAYQWLSLWGPISGTPGQRIMDLIVRRDADLGPPDGVAALVSVVVFYATVALGVIWLGTAFFTAHKRTPHDLLSGLVVVRSRALTLASRGWNMRFGGSV